MMEEGLDRIDWNDDFIDSLTLPENAPGVELDFKNTFKKKFLSDTYCLEQSQKCTRQWSSYPVNSTKAFWLGTIHLLGGGHVPQHCFCFCLMVGPSHSAQYSLFTCLQ